jgi:F-type H+-transporting ATPase subunit alpha
VIYAATNGYLDRVSVDRVAEFNQELVERLHSSASETLETLADGDWSDETQKALDKAISEFADDFGYDLDEEGEPEDKGDEDRSDDTSDDNGGDDDDSEESSEKEPVGAGSSNE